MIQMWICPHCLEEIDIVDEYNYEAEDEEEIDCTCTKCYKEFFAIAKVEISFLSYKKTNPTSS